MTFNFSPATAIVTLVVAPILYFALRRIATFAKTHVGYVLDTVFFHVSKAFMQSRATRFSLSHYCKLQLDDPSTRYLNVPGRVATTLETDAVFVPLTLERAGQGHPIHSVTALGNRVRIIGDPGSGKSSLVKQLFRNTCRAGQRRNVVIYAGGDDDPRRLPVRIELKGFIPPSDVADADLGQWAVDVLREVVTAVHGFEMEQLFNSYVAGQGLLVLLDGLDEVASDSYQRTTRAILDLSRRLSNMSTRNTVVLTMRSQFHRQIHADYDEEFPPVAQVAPFTPSDIYQFLTRWPFSGPQFAQVARIYGELTDRPTLREMCRNPLVLAMYVASDQQADETAAPDTRTSFYDQVVEELLVARRSRQLGMAARTTLREQREALLGRLAFENLSDAGAPANTLPWDSAIRHVKELFHCPDDATAIDRLRQLEKDTGIISEEREGESLRFIHLTFCEFLAAKEAAVGRTDGWNAIVNSYQEFSQSQQPQLRTRLNEVIPFALALLPRASREMALNRVAKVATPEMLARCFLETQTYRSACWPGFLEAQRRLISRADPDEWDMTWLEQLHLFNVVLNDAQQSVGADSDLVTVDLEALMRELVGSDPSRLTRVFGAYAQSDPAAALRLAAACGVDLATEEPDLVLRGCAFPPFLTVAIEHAASGGGKPRWAALLAEAGLLFPYVAQRMHANSAPAPLMRMAEGSPPSRQWWPLPTPSFVEFGDSYTDLPVRSVTKNPSAYSCCLTIALDSPDDVTEGLRALQIVKRVPPIGEARSSVLARILATAVGGASALLVWTLGDLTAVMPMAMAVPVCAAVGLAGAQTILAYPGLRLELYGALTGVDFRSMFLWRPYRWQPFARRWTMLRKRMLARVFFGRLLEAFYDVWDLRESQPQMALELGEPTGDDSLDLVGSAS